MAMTTTEMFWFWMLFRKLRLSVFGPRVVV